MTVSLTALAVFMIFVLWKWSPAQGGHIVAAVVAGVLLAPVLDGPVTTIFQTVASVVTQADAAVQR